MQRQGCGEPGSSLQDLVGSNGNGSGDRKESHLSGLCDVGTGSWGCSSRRSLQWVDVHQQIQISFLRESGFSLLPPPLLFRGKSWKFEVTIENTRGISASVTALKYIARFYVLHPGLKSAERSGLADCITLGKEVSTLRICCILSVMWASDWVIAALIFLFFFFLF